MVYEHEDFQVTAIGSISLGIDGADEFFQAIHKNLSPINADTLLQIFESKFYTESHQEAGGYYCKNFEVYTHPVHDYRAIVRVEHRYDI